MTLTRGDRRRTALLEALDEHLREAPHGSLDDINVADLSRRAGVTRSAFYFYFENKAAAVAALMEDTYREAIDAAELLGGSGAVRDEVASAIHSVFDGARRRTHVHRAMLEARATSPAVRERWEAYQDSFVQVLTSVIEAERSVGAAPAGPDAASLARALLDLNDQTIERLVHAPAGFDWERHVEAVVHLWLSGIYGSSTNGSTA